MNKFEERDLTKLLLFPTISWSCMSGFEYAKKYNRLDEWYKQYVLGIKSVHLNGTMEAGILIGQKLATDPTFLPEVPRPSIYEYELKGKIGKINLIGHIDGWTPHFKYLLEYKTSSNENRWTQDKVHEWGQITFYCLLLWLNHKIRPEDLKIKLIAIPTEEKGDFKVHLSTKKKVKIFETNRTMKDLLLFSKLIRDTHKEMEKFINNYTCT